MSKRQLALWLLLLASSIVLFFHSLIHGEGRGITMIPYGEENTRLLEYTRMGTYLAMLMGVFQWRRSSIGAFWLLLAAIIGRLFLEYYVSVLRYMYEHLSSYRLIDVSLVVVFYLLSLVLPACVLIDLWRITYRGKPS